MDNPFQRRATEYLRDEEAFLAIVSPEPVTTFLRRPGQSGQLYDRLVVVRGTPGSGKTTLARLFTHPTLSALLRHRHMDAYRSLAAAMGECGAIRDDAPTVVGCRLPMETDYRSFWEFPYGETLKLGLLAALIQARAVLAWMRHLTTSGLALGDIEILPRPEAEGAAELIGGLAAEGVVARARQVELSLYRATGALVPPEVSDLDPAATGAYRPFDVIDRIRVRADGAGSIDLLPLVVLDDAHTLHPSQFVSLQHWLARRELRVARWLITRLDLLPSEEVLAAVTQERSERAQLPGLTTRDVTEIMLQSTTADRRDQRVAFRKMAKDMGNRYLRHMPLFSTRSLGSLGDLLSTEPAALPPSRRTDLESELRATESSLRISAARREALLAEVDGYRRGGRKVGEDVRLAMLRILMYRYAKRVPQPSLFGPDADPEPSKPLAADGSVYDAACIHLLHRYGRSYYFGIDDVCDASSENAEQFLRLAATLVEAAAVQLIRGRAATLEASTQHRLLRDQAGEFLVNWNFPHFEPVQRLVTAMAERCVAVSLEPNAWLGAGANAFGIPQEEFDRIPKRFPDLATTLKFGIAYNALIPVPRYSCKGQEWCLLELGGLVVLHHGLTLKRGGFIESSARELATLTQE